MAERDRRGAEPALAPLRARLPAELRDRLPASDALDDWLEALGEALGDAIPAADPALALSLIDALAVRGAAGAAALAHAERSIADRELRKRARRAIHRLRSRGVDVPAPPPGGAGSVLKPLGERSERAFATPPDAAGVRFFAFVIAERGRATVLRALASDERGVLMAERLEGRRADAERFARELVERDDVPAVAVEPEAARACLRRADEARSGPPLAAVDAAALAELTRDGDASTPGERLRAELEPMASDAEAEAAVRARLEAGRMPAWPLTGEGVERGAARIAEAASSPLLLSEMQKRERSERALGETAERVLDRAARERLARRLDETAAALATRGDEDGARGALRVADRLRGDDPPLSIPFLRRLLELSLAAAAERREREARGKLIVPA